MPRSRPRRKPPPLSAAQTVFRSQETSFCKYVSKLGCRWSGPNSFAAGTATRGFFYQQRYDSNQHSTAVACPIRLCGPDGYCNRCRAQGHAASHRHSARPKQFSDLKKLRSANMLASLDAGGLALILLQPGPRPADSSTSNATTATNTQRPLLAQSAYVDLMGTVIDAALKATPQATATQRGPNSFQISRNFVLQIC